jgi:hypothetical protein
MARRGLIDEEAVEVRKWKLAYARYSAIFSTVVLRPPYQFSKSI